MVVMEDFTAPQVLRFLPAVLDPTVDSLKRHSNSCLPHARIASSLLIHIIGEDALEGDDPLVLRFSAIPFVLR